MYNSLLSYRKVILHLVNYLPVYSALISIIISIHINWSKLDHNNSYSTNFLENGNPGGPLIYLYFWLISFITKIFVSQFVITISVIYGLIIGLIVGFPLRSLIQKHPIYDKLVIDDFFISICDFGSIKYHHDD